MAHVTAGDWIELARFERRASAEEIGLVLQALGIANAVRVEVTGNGIAIRVWIVLVQERHLDRARRVLAEEPPEPEPALPTAAQPTTPAPAVRSGLHWVVALMVVNLCVWIAQEGTGGSETRDNLIRFGASHAPSILAGEWWRPVTATFLHIGAKHLLGNLISLGVFGSLTLGSWGAGRFYFIYVISGVAGNLASLAISPTVSAKAGASGSILGLLGALAGRRVREIRHARRTGAAATPSRFKTWHVAAMLVAFYGFALGAHADHLAHVGGIIAGLLFGLLLPAPGRLSPVADRRLGVGCAAATLTLVAVAAALAATRGLGWW